MSAPSAEQLAQINKAHAERIKKLTSLHKKVEQASKRTLSAAFDSSNNHIPQPSPTSSNQTQMLESFKHYDLARQYDSVKSSQPEHDYSVDNEKSSDYNYFNSTLFRQINNEDGNEIKEDELSRNDFMNNYSNGSVSSALQGNDMFKDNNLLSKIDEILDQTKRKTKTKSNINSAYDDFLENKRDMSNSSGFSGSGLSSSNFKMNLTKGKLKTIAEEKATITIDRDQEDRHRQERNQKYREKSKHEHRKSNPHLPPLASMSTIERQQKKLQQMMQQMKQTKQQERSSSKKERQQILFDLSDDESQKQSVPSVSQQDKQVIKIENKRTAEEEQKNTVLRQNLLNERNLLVKELEEVDRELTRLEEEEENDDIDF